MSMITFNIIPEAYETRFRLRRIYITARYLILLLIIYMLLLGTMLLGARLILQREFTRIVNETSLVTADNRVLEKKVEEMNTFVKDVSVAENKHTRYYPLLMKMTEALPAGITLQAISISEDNVVLITGEAKTRTDLLSFKDSLEEINAVEKVDLPVDELVQASDLLFRIEFDIVQDELNGLML